MIKPINVLGISACYHDSAAALLVDGENVAAAQEERFTRKKHDAAFPAESIRFCLDHAGLTLADVDYVTFYDKPLIKFERLLETYLSYVPNGFRSFLLAIPVWLKEKLFLKVTLKRELSGLSGLEQSSLPPLLFHEHHGSHAASAFFPSPFDKAAVLCLDGVGEWATSSVWLGDGNQLTPQWEIQFPHSLGLLYSAFTYYTGFKVNSGEYKLMGLAPYGEPKYVNLIFDELIDLKPDGTFRLDMRYFSYATGLTMTNQRFDALFGGPPRQPEAELTQREMDIAASIQAVTEEIVLRLVKTATSELDVEKVCLAGGALGAALATWHEYLGKPRTPEPSDAMRGSYLGQSYSNDDVTGYLNESTIPFEAMDDGALLPKVAGLLDKGKVIGWFNGAMEFGPRALGARSILGDARNPDMQTTMNLKIKNRESFRPFAPAVLADKVSDWFDATAPSPYMLIVSEVHPDKRLPPEPESEALFGIDKLKVARSAIPAVTHVDYSARIQTVHKDTNPRFHRLLSEFDQATGCPVLVNTSFNVRGEPIVASPEDAYRCFMRTEMDYLVLENCLLEKSQQPDFPDDETWKDEFELD